MNGDLFQHSYNPSPRVIVLWGVNNPPGYELREECKAKLISERGGATKRDGVGAGSTVTTTTPRLTGKNS